MKMIILAMTILMSTLTFAETNCDVRVGETAGVKVLEFTTGNVVHSKMSLREGSPKAILEEMVNLQDMGICTEKIFAKKCILKLEKKPKLQSITLYRGSDKWKSWAIRSKKEAQDFVVSLKRSGFCS